MASDLRAAIEAKLDDLADDHKSLVEDPELGCCPGGCVYQAVEAVRAVLTRHQPDGEFCGECDWVRPCGTVRVIAQALGIRDASGARVEAGHA